MGEEILKITRISIIAGLFVGAYYTLSGWMPAILASLLGWPYTAELGTMIVAFGCFSAASFVGGIFALRAKEWKELKIFFIFAVAVYISNIINTTIFVVTYGWGAILNYVLLGFMLVLIITCCIKQEKK